MRTEIIKEQRDSLKWSNKNIDYAIEKIDAVNSFLCQATDEKISLEKTLSELEGIFEA